jgi:hypothetical protein
MENNTVDRGLLFFTALIQVSFVAMNVNFISNGKVLPMLMTSFVLSLVWTFNVKKVAFGNIVDRMIYAGGAMCGTGIGFLMSHYIIKVTCP